MGGDREVAARRSVLLIGQLVGVRLVVQVMLVGALAGDALALREAGHDEPVAAARAGQTGAEVMARRLQDALQRTAKRGRLINSCRRRRPRFERSMECVISRARQPAQTRFDGTHLTG